MLTRLSNEEALELLEQIRWPNGPVCPHCGSSEHKALNGAKCRPGLKQCKNKECRKQYTVTVNTVMERSHLSAWQWVYLFARMSESKKGVSALQLSRELGVTYKTAWFACHRVRYAMTEPTDGTKLGGPDKVVEADEAFHGGRPRFLHAYARVRDKVPVVTLVERGGKARSVVTNDVNSSTLRKHLTANADAQSTLMTDSHSGYHSVGKHFAGHFTVNHAKSEYARKVKGGPTAHNNTAESYFSLFKRSVYGSFHHLSKEHLQRYMNELDFRWNHRKMSDNERTMTALAMSENKRLTYRNPKRPIQG